MAVDLTIKGPHDFTYEKHFKDEMTLTEFKVRFINILM